MVKKTLIYLKNNLIALVILSLILLGIYMIVREEPEITKNNSEILELTDERIVELSNNLKNNDLLRQASIKNENIDSESMIKYIFDNLKSEDYKEYVIKPRKIECNVTNNIKFISNETCYVLVISNEKINEYQLKFFNTNRNLRFDNLNYKALECQNDGTYYYCMKKSYDKKYNSYSIIKNAYKKEDKIYIQDYYLFIDLTNKDKCLAYYNEEYCNNYTKLAIPEISEDTIKENSVIYESVYVLSEFGYYLEESYII